MCPIFFNLSLRANEMIKKLTIAALMLSLMPLAGCGSSDPHEQVMEEMMDCMEEMTTILASVTDKASAEAAKPKLEAAGKRMEASKKRMDEVGKPDEAKEKALKEKYEERMKGIMEKMMKENMRVMMNLELGKILGDAMKGAQPK
jgi:outer membrane murein-binding lipoprotein Lpp